MTKDILRRLEGFLICILLKFFAILQPEKASNLGGLIGRTIGPRLAASHKAKRNLQTTLPHADHDKIITEMWDNLGRIVAEYAHLQTLSCPVKIIGEDHLKAALHSPKGAIFIGGHIGNWELNAATVLTQFGVAPNLTYRPPNNPYIDKMLMRARSINGQINAFPKSASGGKALIRAIKAGEATGILIDQKYNEGLSIPFFGREAMTNPAFVQLAQKYDLPLYPIRNERLKGTEFTLTIYPPLKTRDEDGNDRPVEDVIKDAHALLESWITERPDQWLWLHRRWKKT